MPPLGFQPETMAHHEMLTGLYVGLLRAPLELALARIPKELTPAARQKALAGIFARAQHSGWRWKVVGDGVHLAWKVEVAKLWKKRVMRPDAVLELTEPRRRLFIECETGSNTIVPQHGDNKPNSTLNKLDRWRDFIEGYASYQPRVTHYEEKYRDGYAPEVLFLVHSERRARNVTAAVEQWRTKQRERPELVVRVWTLQTALGELLPVSGALKAEAEKPRAGLLPVVANVLSPVEAAAIARFITDTIARLDEELHHAKAGNYRPPPLPGGLEMAKRVAKRLTAGLPPGLEKTRRAPVTAEVDMMKWLLGNVHATMDAVRRAGVQVENPAGLGRVAAILKTLG